MKKNVAGQFIGAQMITAADGTAFTGTVTVYVTGNAGTQAIGSVGSGVCTHEGNGFHTYAPAQAETNYDHVAFTFIGTGAIPATVQVFTGFPQTVDNATNITAIKSTVDTNLNATVSSRMAAYTQPTGFLAATFPASVASPTNITGGVITTVTNLTNLPAITAGWLTATGIAASALNGKGNWNIGKTGYSLTATTGLGNQTANLTGNLSGSVGAVTGAVGSVAAGVTVTTNNDKTGYALSAAGVDAVWDEPVVGHQTALTAGRALSLGGAVIAETTAAGTPTTSSIQITDGSAIDGFYEDQPFLILSGSGLGQVRIVSTYTGATKTCTFDEPFAVAPSAGAAVAITMQHVHPIEEIADGILLRKLDRSGNGTDAAQERTVVNALRTLRNKAGIAAGTLTVTKEDDVSTAWTAAVTTAAGNPISEVDPT